MVEVTNKQWANTDNLTPWKPGQSGNPKGRPPNTRYLSEITRELLEQVPKGEAEGRNADILVALALIRKALGGDTKAIEMIHDWTEGPVTTTHRLEVMAMSPDQIEMATRRVKEADPLLNSGQEASEHE